MKDFVTNFVSNLSCGAQCTQRQVSERQLLQTISGSLHTPGRNRGSF